MDAIVLLILSTVIGLISTAFWRWVAQISEAAKDNSAKLELARNEMAQFRLDVANDYQKKADAHLDNERIIKGLDDIKTDVKELSHKLDRKMDKQ